MTARPPAVFILRARAGAVRWGHTTMQPTERFINIGDVALNVAEFPGDGPPLVLVHGWGVSWEVWLSVAPRLARDFRVIAFDLRGHGRSGRVRRDHHRRMWAEDTLRLMEMLTPDGAYVVGHSMGGWIALVLPSMAPDMVKKLVAEDPYTGPNSLVGDRAQGDESRRFRPEPEFLASITSIEPIAREIAERNPHYAQDIVERLATMQFRIDPALVSGAGTRSEPETSYDDAFRKIACPALLMHGNPEKGGIMDTAEATRMAGVVPGLQVIHWPRAGHNLHVARNYDFARQVRRFLLE